MCEVRDYDGRSMGGRIGFDEGPEGDLLWDVKKEARIIARDEARADGKADAADFDFFCRHGDGPWEPLELPPPPGKMTIIPAGSTIRAVPKDPEYVIPEPEPPRLTLGGMI